MASPPLASLWYPAAGAELKDICPGPCDKQKDGTVPCSTPGPCQTLPGTCSGDAQCSYVPMAAGTPCAGGFCDAQGACVVQGEGVVVRSRVVEAAGVSHAQHARFAALLS